MLCNAAEAAAHAINMAGCSKSTQRERKTRKSRDWRHAVSCRLIRAGGGRGRGLIIKNLTNTVRAKGLHK